MNNEAEYKALILGIKLARALRAQDLKIFSDSQLVVGQIKGEFQAKDERMQQYLAKAKFELEKFPEAQITQIPRQENSNADALARLASAKDAAEMQDVKISTVDLLEIAKPVMVIQASNDWRTDIITYLSKGELPEDRQEARSLKSRSAKYILLGQILYRRSYSAPLLRCLGSEEADYALREVHKGICGNHSRGQALAHKILHQGFYWPNMTKAAIDLVRKYEQCQKNSNFSKHSPTYITSMSSPIPFAEWGIDLIGALPLGKHGCKYAL